MSSEQQQLPPPPPYMAQYRDRNSHGSFGPLIAVLAVITVLAVVAGIVGRLCYGRSIMGYGHYDLEGWIERKCASCIDGRLDATPTPPNINVAAGVAANAPVISGVDAGAQEAKRSESSADP